MPQIRRMGYLLILLVGVALVTAQTWKPAPPPKFVGLASVDVPKTIGSYRSVGDYEMSPDVKAALASADIISRNYTSGTSAIDFVLIGGTDREALHDPRSCLVGAGWRLEDDHTEPLPGTNIAMQSCHAVGQPGITGYDMMYLYVVDGKLVTAVTRIRAAMLVSALLGRKNTPVYFLRFMQPLSDDPQANATSHKEMQQFAADMWNQLRPKMMKS